MRLNIKNMVCYRCIMLVQVILEKLNIPFSKLELGCVEITEELSEEVRMHLKEDLTALGLELYEDKKSVLVEQIKSIVVAMICDFDDTEKRTYSEYLSRKLNREYAFLATTFSEITGSTIQQFIVETKIEKVKELIMLEKLTLSEISYKLNYSSLAHLSNQFKKHTGLTPSLYKEIVAKTKKDVRNERSEQNYNGLIMSLVTRREYADNESGSFS